MVGREDYEERKQAKIDRLNDASSKASEAATVQYNRSHDLVKDIPFGQPNIEGRSALPNLRKKSWNALERAIENDNKADYYKERAEASESNTAISSDDPQAIIKLKEKLSALEEERENIKASNKAAKKNGTEIAPWYTLPYLSKDIKRVKERIEKLESIDQMPAEIIQFDGGEIESDPITNRVIIRFNERQGDDIVNNLKSNGFRWAPSVKAWQRLRNRNALNAAKHICGIIN